MRYYRVRSSSPFKDYADRNPARLVTSDLYEVSSRTESWRQINSLANSQRSDGRGHAAALQFNATIAGKLGKFPQ